MSDAAAEIAAAEERLRRAMLDGDVAALDLLLSHDMLFTGADGARMDKQQDLAAHRDGLLRLERAVPVAPPLVRIIGDAAIVAVTMDLAGRFDDVPFAGRFAYTRLWCRADEGGWRIEAAHCSSAAG